MCNSVETRVTEDQISMLEEKLTRICNWIMENPNTDPNAYEMSEVFIEASRLKGNITSAIEDKLVFIKEKRFSDYRVRLNLPIESPLYSLQLKLYLSALNGDPVTYDPVMQEYICKCSSIYLYIIQESKRNPSFKYNNNDEFFQLKQMRVYCIENGYVTYTECNIIIAEIEQEF